jgi:glucose-1-phosphate thymidylyltransferase
LVEKPETFVSNQAVIGIYYFKALEDLKAELQQVLDQNIIHGGEYQINDGIKGMMSKGNIFKTGTVDEWMDCGNKNVTLETNSKMLGFIKNDGLETMIADSVILENSKIIEPCMIAENVVLKNTTVGPNVSIGKDCVLVNVEIKDSLVQNNSQIKNAKLTEAMIGNHVKYDGEFTKISIGDYTTME